MAVISPFIGGVVAVSGAFMIGLGTYVEISNRRNLTKKRKKFEALKTAMKAVNSAIGKGNYHQAHGLLKVCFKLLQELNRMPDLDGEMQIQIDNLSYMYFMYETNIQETLVAPN